MEYSIQYAVRRLKELRDKRVQRSTKGKSWWNFLQRVLLCTNGVHDQLADIYLQEYLRILWIKKYKTFKNILNSEVLCFVRVNHKKL